MGSEVDLVGNKHVLGFGGIFKGVGEWVMSKKV